MNFYRYELMLQCWHIDPEVRPSFLEIQTFFQDKFAQVKGIGDKDDPSDMPSSKVDQAMTLEIEDDDIDVYIGMDVLNASSSSTYDSRTETHGYGYHTSV